MTANSVPSVLQCMTRYEVSVKIQFMISNTIMEYFFSVYFDKYISSKAQLALFSRKPKAIFLVYQENNLIEPENRKTKNCIYKVRIYYVNLKCILFQ